MENHEIEAYKKLAASVIIVAISDLKSREHHDSSKRFLTSPERKEDRSLWLNWLGYDDEAFQKLLRQQSLKTFANRVTKFLR